MAGLIQVWDTPYPHFIGPGVHLWDVSSPFSSGGALIVGSGIVPSGFSGYYQFANGIFDEAGGALSVYGPIDLNGTLDILLGDGYKPVGSVFKVLSGGMVTGTFSNVEGLVFDGGRERYALDYESHYVDLIVENNTTPEPGSVFLTSLAFIALFATGIVRKRSATKRA
ncbi:MAG: hypothetical protein M3Y24_02185 [Acidobacteriota bacterium]|nr:hypothetical protein [Acidobacteriota bacterium]